MALLAHLTGGRGDGRIIDIPLERLPQQVEFVTGAGAVAYERVGHTAQYRPAAVLDKLAPAAKKPKRSGARAARPAFRS